MFEIYYAMFELQVQRLQNSLTELQMPSQVSGFKHCTRTLICRGKLLREDCIWTFKPVPAFGNWKTHVLWMFELNQGQLDLCDETEVNKHLGISLALWNARNCNGVAKAAPCSDWNKTQPYNKTHVLQRANDSKKMEKVKSEVSFDVFWLLSILQGSWILIGKRQQRPYSTRLPIDIPSCLGFAIPFVGKLVVCIFCHFLGRHSQLQKKQLHRWHRSHWNLGTKPLSFVKRNAMVTAFVPWNSQESYSQSNSALRSLQLLAGMAQLISNQFLLRGFEIEKWHEYDRHKSVHLFS